MNLSRIGPFAIEEHLGSGDETSVYRAVHIQQRRVVALKVFPAPLVSNDAQAKSALVREIETLKGLHHPNIAKCYGGILNASQGCIASELIHGESLDEILSRRGRLTWETVVDYSLQISAALEHAHEAGVIHQDLSPAKILISEGEKLKVIDFRVDRTNNSTCVSSHKRTPHRCRYLAPEQLRGESKLTNKVDLYALGCVMYQMLVGQTAFDADTAEETARLHLESDAARVGSIVLDCPVWLESLVGQLLEKSPAKRPHGAAAVTMALQETNRKVAAKTGVVEHAAGGFSPLRRQVDKDMARDLLRKARRESLESEQADPSPIFERPWVLATCLLAIAASVTVWLLWPVSEARLLGRAKTIVAASDGVQREQARRYLDELLEKFPNGQHSDEAQALVDELDMASAERGLRIRARLGKEPRSEGERHYAEAYEFEQFGDRLTAIAKYQSMVDLLPREGEDRAFVNLARRQIAAIEKDSSGKDRVHFVEQRLQDAEDFAEQGRLIDARKIWTSIVNLYGNNQEFSVQVDRAQSKLSERRDSPAEEPQAVAPSEAQDNPDN